jgi:hypothetical protein
MASLLSNYDYEGNCDARIFELPVYLFNGIDYIVSPDPSDL